MFDDIYKNKRVLVTGHTGFKGSWLTLWLTELCAGVTGYSLEPPTDPNLFESLDLKNKITHIHGDIRDGEKLKKVFAETKPEFVFHLAAQPIVRRSYKEPGLTYETNVIGTLNVFEAARSVGGVKVVVNVTSDKCYENKEKFEGYAEDEPMGGYDPYSSSKGCSEILTTAYRSSYFNPKDFGDTHSVAMASARAGNVIGGGDWALDRLIPDCLRSILSSEDIIIRCPDAIRPWQHVLEPLGGYLLLGQKLYEDGPKFAQGWNFGPKEDDARSVKWIVDSLCSKLRYEKKIVVVNDNEPHEAKYLKLNCTKANEKLGWHPKWDVGTALDKIAEWFDAYKNEDDIRDVCVSQIQEYSCAKKNN